MPPRSLKIQQMYQHLRATIISDRKYHDRWIIDEELANAIKDEEGNVLGTYTNLNRITTSLWTFNHQCGHLIGDVFAIAKFVIKK